MICGEQRSHNLEVENEKQFLRDLYAQLSPNARAEVDTRIDNAHNTGSISRSNLIRANRGRGMSDEDAEAFLKNFVRGCINVRNRAADMAAKNWIEEPTIIAMEYKGAEK